jgi:ABC-type sugar transport system, ATPase component
MKSPLAALRAGVVLLSGDRTAESLFPVLSVRTNTTIQVLRSLGRFGLLWRRREARTVDEMGRRLRIRMASIEQPVQSLSGGNQQKVSLTRPFLRGDVKLILADEPTQGVDVGARFDIYEALRAKADEGVAIRRQVERPARARRALRPRDRDLTWADHRRDPRRRARRAPDRRGDRRLRRLQGRGTG